MERAIAAAEAALAAADPWDGLTGYVRACVGFRAGALAPLAGAIATTPAMWEASRRGRELLDEVVASAHHGGGLRPDVTTLDVAWLIGLFSRHGGAAAGPQDENARQRPVATAPGRLRARRPGPRPGTPPTRTHHAGRRTPRRPRKRRAEAEAARRDAGDVRARVQPGRVRHAQLAHVRRGRQGLQPGPAGDAVADQRRPHVGVE